MKTKFFLSLMSLYFCMIHLSYGNDGRLSDDAIAAVCYIVFAGITETVNKKLNSGY